jgi:hypothetical protein
MTTHITKTWFDGEKVVTQEIPEADFYKPSMTKDEAPASLKDAALKLALEALKVSRDMVVDQKYAPLGWSVTRFDEVLTTGKEALAQPEQPTLDQQLAKARADRNKAYADWSKAHAVREKASADWGKANAEIHRIEALIREAKAND